MCITRFFGAGLTRQEGDEGRFALHEQGKSGMHGIEVLKSVHAVGTRAQFAGSLWPAQKQNTKQRNFVAVKIEHFLKTVLEFGDAAVRISRAYEELVRKRTQRLADGVFVKRHDGLAIRLLIAGIQQGIDGERIVFRCGDFLFNEAAEDASFGGGQLIAHREMIHSG